MKVYLQMLLAQIGCWCEGGKTEEGEPFHLGVERRVQRRRICGSRVCPHVSLMDALA